MSYAVEELHEDEDDGTMPRNVATLADLMEFADDIIWEVVE